MDSEYSISWLLVREFDSDFKFGRFTSKYKKKRRVGTLNESAISEEASELVQNKVHTNCFYGYSF